MAHYTLYIFVGRTTLLEWETERAWTACKISWPFGIHVFLLIAWMKVFFFLRGGDNHCFKYQTIHLGIYNLPVLHASGYYREKSYGMVQDTDKRFQI